MAEKYSEQRVTDALATLNGDLAEGQYWAIVDGKLHKTFVFQNFIQAFGWMTQMAICAEQMNHHPEWFNVYSKVRVDLTTHDAGGISELDFTLASKMDAAAH